MAEGEGDADSPFDAPEPPSAPPSTGALRALGWLDDAEDREVDASDTDFFALARPAPAVASGPPTPPHRDAALVARPAANGVATQLPPRRRPPSTVYGRGVEASDLELQPLGTGCEDSEPPMEESSTERPRKPLYEVWPARSRFYCRGACMTGGETETGITENCSFPNLCTWTCILAPSSLYFVWVFPHLWKHGVYAMPLATLAVFLMATGFLLATCCSDPGVIPRREVILATKSAAKLEAALGYDALARETVPLDGKGGGRSLPAELTSRGYRWCRTCRIVRPPRASHCPDCDNCVLRYDHHCPFVNNCVGQRNYHFFFGFVTSVLCLACMVLPMLFWFLNSDNFELSVVGLMHVGSGVLQPVFYLLILAGSLVGVATLLSFLFWAYHVFLIATKRTTKEFRRSIDNIAEEPTLCAKRGPRLFNPWALVDPREVLRVDEEPPPPPAIVCSACLGED